MHTNVQRHFFLIKWIKNPGSALLAIVRITLRHSYLHIVHLSTFLDVEAVSAFSLYVCFILVMSCVYYCLAYVHVCTGSHSKINARFLQPTNM